ncbi:2-oxo-4-hydroxy-4-carboxy-5-ureidoimidazoline decarboxylase [Zoogloea dura]|jgi:2-oxo-4-hydroxy-4-carboxy-5-ureidoimidazoline decarboxylase|uniref:2-oxo-4-hydroxy-4-carboxy-5-ureidoimidazoline decarboxylase n=1 Tax=Zoogloea dura TaxID=2728840 RepID=A0A848G2Q1_9RHOO|nr:2-oxo-4-hydroxy-4-carboxy-5-ureidoimidazoline decarboxylase [Zoogloea dura]NML26477.1 2-oxo-4-hydroxy-4-carboxy-5-ureidoimidazoline decarboxylase [Zoogloea dura]
MTTTTLETLSAADRDGFVARLADIFEHSPWIPERAWAARPFASVDALHAAMLAVLDAASDEEKLGLIRAHPELAGKEAAAGTLTTASTGEQRGAGLDQCSAEELARLRRLNAQYRERFGFPFVIAVKGLSRYQIMDAVEARLARDRAGEFRTCLTEIGKIARFRLDALLAV